MGSSDKHLHTPSGDHLYQQCAIVHVRLFRVLGETRYTLEVLILHIQQGLCIPRTEHVGYTSCHPEYAVPEYPLRLK